jgi:protease-4
MIRNLALIKSLLLDAWLIEPDYAQLMRPAVIDLIEGKSTTNLLTHEKQIPYFLNADSHLQLAADTAGNFAGFSDAPSGSAAIIPIRGAITKYDGICNYGVETYMQWIDQAEQSPAVTEIILLIDSPGGQANSAFMFARQIKNLKTKTLAYVDGGMGTSAAFLIGSACDQFWVNTPVDMLGSIGAMFNISMYGEDIQGTRTWEIYSRLSSEKNLAFRKLKANNDTSLLEDMLDENVVHFIQEVKTNRGDRLNPSEGDPFKGATYTATKALKLGLIDGIGPLRDALGSLRNSTPKIIASVSTQTQILPQTTTENTQNETEMNWKQKLAAWLVEQPDEATATAETPAPETPVAETPTPQAETPAPQSTLEDRFAALELQMTTLKTENTQLKANKPAAEPTTPTVTNETVPTPVQHNPETTSFFSETDEAVAKMKAGMV